MGIKESGLEGGLKKLTIADSVELLTNYTHGLRLKRELKTRDASSYKFNLLNIFFNKKC